MGKKRDLFTDIIFFACLLFYGFFAVFDGAVICADSPSYINMQSSREPLYPVLLALFRGIFQKLQDGFYLDVVAFFQSILMAVAVFILEEYLRKEIQVSKVSSVLIFLMPVAVSLLCRFAARRGSMYSNSILTEGIAIPLYLLFFRFLAEYLISNTKRSLCWCLALSFFMISTRKQMLFAFVMLIAAIIYVACRKKKAGYGILTIFISVVLVLGGNAAFDVGYNYMVRGEKTTHSSDIRFIATVAFYTAEREDAARIEEPDIRELFLDIYDTCEEEGYLGHSAVGGWRGRVSHFGDYYDRIQIDTMWPKTNLYVQEHFTCSKAQISKYEDEVMGKISKAVIPLHAKRVIRVFWDNFLAGLVLTVAQYHPVLIFYSAIMYVLYLAMFILVWKMGKEKNVLIFAAAVFLAVIFNVGLVSLVIFCQTRYTIYNMALFYIALIVMGDFLLRKTFRGSGIKRRR